MTAEWYVYVPVYLLRLGSSLTTITVIYSVFRHEVLNIVAKMCLLIMYFSSFFTDIGYSFTLYCQISHGKILFVPEDVMNPDGTTGICYQPLFYHELGFSLFSCGLFLTGTERLVNSRTNFYLRKKYFSGIIVIFLIPVAAICSITWVRAILDRSTSMPASIAAIVFSLISLGQLSLAVHFNIKNYQVGLGQSLDRRFHSATLYYFNRLLLKSLMGEVIFRLSAFGCIMAIVFFRAYDPKPFGYLSFAYHNLIPVGNLIFPWLLILTREKARRSVFKSKMLGVTDLTGRKINMKNGAQDHYDTIRKMWN